MTPQDQQRLAEILEAETGGLSDPKQPDDGQNVAVMVNDLLKAIEEMHQKSHVNGINEISVHRTLFLGVVAMARDIQGRM